MLRNDIIVEIRRRKRNYELAKQMIYDAEVYVYRLNEFGFSNSKISNILGISENAVRVIKRKVS